MTDATNMERLFNLLDALVALLAARTPLFESILEREKAIVANQEVILKELTEIRKRLAPNKEVRDGTKEGEAPGV